MKINSINELNKYLGIDSSTLETLMYATFKGYKYVSFDLIKKNGKIRTINAPTKSLKEIQHKLYEYLKTIYHARQSSYGFEPGKNNILNAKKHKKRKYILNIDLKDMFSQITANRIRGMLMSEPYMFDESVANAISKITCCRGILPQGAPTSPILSNMILKMLDTKLIKYSREYNLYYTRYADDLTFSANYDFSHIVFINYPETYDLTIRLKHIFESSNFIINNEKTRYYTFYRRQEVTGIVVNKKLNVAKERRKEIRLLLYLCERFGVESTAKKYFEKNNKSLVSDAIITDKFAQILFGKINYLVNVKGDLDIIGIKFREQFNKIFKGNLNFNMDEINTKRNTILRNVVIIESEDMIGSGFLLKGIGFVTAFHVIYDRECSFRKKVSVLYKNENIKISEADIVSQNASFDYVVIRIDKYNDSSNGFSYKKKFFLGDKVVFAGYPDYSRGDDIYIADATVTSLSKKTIVGSVALIDNDIFHGMSGGPVLSESLEVIGYILYGNEMEEFFKNGSTKHVSGFRSIKCIIDDMNENRNGKAMH